MLGRVFSSRSLVQLEALLPDLATGLRAAVATVIPVSLSIQNARPELGWMALGGWLGTLVDPGGSRRARARVVVAFGVLGMGMVGLSEGAARSVMGATVIVASVAFLATMLGVLGAAAARLGTMLCIIIGIGTGIGIGTAGRSHEPWRDALWFGIGSCVAVVLSSILWPIGTHLPVRRAVANVFRELASYVRAVEECMARGAPMDDAQWTLVGRRHARRVREAIQAARAMSLAIHARRSGQSRVGSNLRVLLGLVEAQFLVVVTLGTELETAGTDPARSSAEARSSLASLAKTYDAVFSILVARVWSPRSFVPPAPPRAAPGDILGELSSDLAQESGVALSLACDLERTETSVAATDPTSAPVDPTLAVYWKLLRDALVSRSLPARHAIRVSVGGAAAVFVGGLLSPLHGSWVTVTTLVVLQPYAAATVRRAAERIAGTVAGGLIAIAITLARPGPLALAAIMFPLSIAAVVTRPRSYRLFTFFLTPLFVLIATHTPGDWWVAAARAGDAAIGGGIALLATLLIFPRWEGSVLTPQVLAAMEQAGSTYADAVVTSLQARDPGALQRIDETRLSAAAALGAAEDALDRLLEDPRPNRQQACALELVTYGRRLVLATTALDTLAAKRDAGRAVPIDAAVARVHRFATLLRQSAAREKIAEA